MSLLPVLAPTTLTEAGRVSTGETILFGVVAIVAVACGLGLLTAKRAVTAAANMIGIMICLAVLYVANEAPFLGITQVVVYTGAVMTLVLFVIMMVGVGGDEPVGSAGTAVGKWVIAVLGIGLAAVLVAVVARSSFPGAVGLAGDGETGSPSAPAALAEILFGRHVAAMELTGVLLVIAAVGALTLTHRQRVRARVSQRDRMEARMRDFAVKGIHPGQKPMPGVYAATNSAAAPALGADGAEIDSSIPRVLRVRGQGLELAEASPETDAARRAGTIEARENAVVGRSGMSAMPGAPAPVVAQPQAPGAPGAGDEAQAPAEGQEPTEQTKEEQK